MQMKHTERAELIAAIAQLTAGSEHILSLAERLRLMGTPAGLSAAELAEARSRVTVWREQFDVLRVRVASLTIPPAERLQ